MLNILTKYVKKIIDKKFQLIVQKSFQLFHNHCIGLIL